MEEICEVLTLMLCIIVFKESIERERSFKSYLRLVSDDLTKLTNPKKEKLLFLLRFN